MVDLLHTSILYEHRSKLLHPIALIVFFWLLGFGGGVVYTYFNRYDAIPFFRTAVTHRVSVIPRLCEAYIILIISAASCHFSNPYPLAFPTFAIGFSLGFCLKGLLLTFSSAGWLIALLCLFSNTWIIILPFACWIRNRFSLRHKIGFCFFILSVVILFDYFFISPFLIKLFNYVQRS